MAIEEEVVGSRFFMSFERLPFMMESGTYQKGNETFTEIIQDLGSREQFSVAGRAVWTLRCVIEDDRPMARWAELDQAFANPGTMIHPQDGRHEVIPLTWTRDDIFGQLTFLRFQVTFASATLPPVATDVGFVAQTPEQLAITLGETAKLMALEPIPLVSLEALRAQLAIPDTVVGEEYLATSATLLANDAGLKTTGTPRVIQRLGSSARAAATGQLTPEGFRAVVDNLLLEEIASNSFSALSQMRVDWSMFLSVHGARAFGQEVIAPQGLLQRLDTTLPLSRLAELNPESIWRIRIAARL